MAASNESGLYPVEFNVVVKPDAVETVSAGGIIMRTNSAAEREKLAIEEGVLIAASPMAFSYADWPEGARKPQVGDRVMWKRFAGLLRERNGHDYRVLLDKDIVAIIEESA